MSDITVTAHNDPDDVALFVAGKGVRGWTDVTITRRAEGLPNSFEVALTALDPKTLSQNIVAAGDSCEVHIGSDTVITGYVDRVVNAGGPDAHMLRIIGRGKCCDLVDCSAEWPGGQIIGANVLEVAKKLAAPYDLDVTIADGIDPGPAVPQLNLNYGETAFAIIDRLTRAAGLLAYEDAAGNLVLARAGTTTAASGAAYGQNVQAWECVSAVDQRYSDICCALLGVDILGDLGEGGNFTFTATDPNITRHRLIYLVAEAAPDPVAFVKQRALWEQARRAGRGTQVRVTVDSWRDSAGKLWEPNTLVPVDVPGLTLADKLLAVAEVTYHRDDATGTTADLLLMPKEAFLPEPIVLIPVALGDVQ